MASGLADVRVDYMAGLAPHRPVSIGFHPRLASICAQYLQAPDSLDTQRKIGPLWQSPQWAELLQETRVIRDKAKLGQERHAARIELAAVLPKIADAIEDELVRASGNNPPPRRRRYRGINAKWKRVLKYKDRQALNSAATRWALQACRDLHKRPSDQVQLDWNTVLSGGI